MAFESVHKLLERTDHRRSRLGLPDLLRDSEATRVPLFLGLPSRKIEVRAFSKAADTETVDFVPSGPRGCSKVLTGFDFVRHRMEPAQMTGSHSTLPVTN